MYLPLFLYMCLYESFWKGFEFDQAVNIAGYQNAFACLANRK